MAIPGAEELGGCCCSMAVESGTEIAYNLELSSI